jgi:hypothetical protein
MPAIQRTCSWRCSTRGRTALAPEEERVLESELFEDSQDGSESSGEPVGDVVACEICEKDSSALSLSETHIWCTSYKFVRKLAPALSTFRPRPSKHYPYKCVLQTGGANIFACVVCVICKMHPCRRIVRVPYNLFHVFV